MRLPLVSIVIPNWNGRPLLQEFMPSVVGLDYPSLEWIVVDNASTDGSAEFLEQQYPAVRVIRNSRNDGTAEGSNIGAWAARGEYLFFLSNDMWIEPNALALMMRRMLADASIGICSLKMRRITAAGERLMVLDSVGATTDPFGFPDARGIHQPDRGQLDEHGEVFFVFGGALLIRRQLFEQLGGYDTAYFTLTDDIDLCWRARLLGYRVVVEPAAVLYHRVSATLDTPAFKRARRRFLSERNTLRTLLKNYSWWNLCWIMPLDMALLAAETFFYLALGKWALVRSGPRAVWWNLCRWRETMALRRKVQQSRTVADRAVWRHMKRGSGKVQVLAAVIKAGGGPLWQSFLGREAAPKAEKGAA